MVLHFDCHWIKEHYAKGYPIPTILNMCYYKGFFTLSHQGTSDLEVPIPPRFPEIQIDEA